MKRPRRKKSATVIPL